jgi:hypothetical protein
MITFSVNTLTITRPFRGRANMDRKETVLIKITKRMEYIMISGSGGGFDCGIGFEGVVIIMGDRIKLTLLILLLPICRASIISGTIVNLPSRSPFSKHITTLRM